MRCMNLRLSYPDVERTLPKDRLDFMARCLRSYCDILISVGLRKQKLDFTAWQLWI